MIWYLLFSFLAMIVVGAVLDAVDARPVFTWTAGFVAGFLFTYGLVIQFGELLHY